MLIRQFVIVYSTCMKKNFIISRVFIKQALARKKNYILREKKNANYFSKKKKKKVCKNSLLNFFNGLR